MLNNKKNNKGFTLVELLVVIAIIGILAVVAVPALFKNIEKGKIAELESDISAIRSAALSYYADHSAYPADGDKINNDDKKTALEGEIESVGLPFGGEYTLNGTAPQPLTLTIPADKISTSGIQKLEKDLGKEVTKDGNNIKVTLIEGNTASSN